MAQDARQRIARAEKRARMSLYYSRIYGVYANMTGNLRVWGTQDLTDGTFSEHLLAKLCVPKKKQH